MRTNDFKNCILILAIVNYRNWLNVSPLLIKSEIIVLIELQASKLNCMRFYDCVLQNDIFVYRITKQIFQRITVYCYSKFNIHAINAKVP